MGESFKYCLLFLCIICYSFRRVDADSSCGCDKLDRGSSISTSSSYESSCSAAKDLPKSHLYSKMALIKGGVFEIGTDSPIFTADGEAPARKVHLDDYYIDLYETSNEEFNKFVESTSYVTEAEKFGSSFVFDGILSEEVKAEVSQVVAGAPWWMNIPNTTWRHPEGPNSSLLGAHCILCISYTL